MKPFRLFFALAVALISACYSAPVVQPVDTARQQAELRSVATQLDGIPDRVENRIVPQDRLVIHHASNALQDSAASLAVLTEKNNACAKDLETLGSHYRDTVAQLKECKSETGIMARISGFFSRVGLFFVGLGSGVILTLVGIVAMHVSGSLAGVLARIPAR
jgi:hypothetical protein